MNSIQQLDNYTLYNMASQAIPALTTMEGNTYETPAFGVGALGIVSRDISDLNTFSHRLIIPTQYQYFAYGLGWVGVLPGGTALRVQVVGIVDSSAGADIVVIDDSTSVTSSTIGIAGGPFFIPCPWVVMILSNVGNSNNITAVTGFMKMGDWSF